MWHGLVLGILALIILLVIVVVFVKKRKSKKLMYAIESLPHPTTIIVYDQQNGHLAFENNMYVEANRNNTDIERTQQQGVPAIPSQPPVDDLFYPTKPVRQAEYEEPSVGAQGVAYDNCRSAEKAVDKEMTKIQKCGVPRLGESPKERAEDNPYADFKSLTSKKKVVEDSDDIVMSDIDDFSIEDEEDLYQELDEVAMRADIPPTLLIDTDRDGDIPFVPPLREESMIPQQLPPAVPMRNSPTQVVGSTHSPTFEYDDPIDDDDSHPYAEVNKSRHSIETLPARGDYHVPAEGRGSIVSDTSGYEVPSGLGPRHGHSSIHDNSIYDSPRNSGATSTLPDSNALNSFSPNEYNVPSSLPRNKEMKRPVGLLVTSDPWADDPFLSSDDTRLDNNNLDNGGHTVLHIDDIDLGNHDNDLDDNDDDSDDDEPEDIKRLKDEVKDSLDFVLLNKETPDASNA